jgi:hypothetical protein
MEYPFRDNKKGSINLISPTTNNYTCHPQEFTHKYEFFQNSTICRVTLATAPAGKLRMEFKKWASAYQLHKSWPMIWAMTNSFKQNASSAINNKTVQALM